MMGQAIEASESYPRRPSPSRYRYPNSDYLAVSGENQRRNATSMVLQRRLFLKTSYRAKTGDLEMEQWLCFTSLSCRESNEKWVLGDEKERKTGEEETDSDFG